MKLKSKILFFILVCLNQTYSQKGYDVERKEISIKEFKSLKVYSGLEVRLIPSNKNIAIKERII